MNTSNRSASNDPPKLWLASSSPRRAALLHEAGFAFAVLPSTASAIDETPCPHESAEVLVCRLAQAKARAALRSGAVPEGGVVLSGDTVVSLDGAVLGKPENAEAAMRMLSALSGRSHRVFTALCAGSTEASLQSVLVGSTVLFKDLSPAEIADYVATGEPLDKAGSYAIQGRAAQWIIHLEGSYGAVVGLPQYELAQLLADCGVHPLWHNVA